MAVAIIQESGGGFLLIARQLDEAVSSRARDLQPTLGCGGPPRLTCKHRLDELQARGTIRAVFHPFHPSFSGRFSTLLGRIVPQGVKLFCRLASLEWESPR